MSKSTQCCSGGKLESAGSVGLDSAEKEKGSIFCTSLDKEQFPPDPGMVDELPPGISESDIVTVRLSENESLVVPISVQGKNLQAVVDSRAGACIIRKQLYESLNPKPPIIHSMYLRGIGEGLTPRYEVEVKVKVGSTVYHGPAYVTTMNDDFLLGLHFMKATLCDILFSESCIWLGGEKGERIPATLKRIENRDYQVSRVVMARRVVVPPNTVKIADVKLVDPVSEEKLFCVEPHQKNKGLLMAATLTPGKSKVKVQIINDSDRYIMLKSGHSVGLATEIKEVIGSGPELGTTSKDNETLLKTDWGQSVTPSTNKTDWGQSVQDQLKNQESDWGQSDNQRTKGNGFVSDWGQSEPESDWGQSDSQRENRNGYISDWGQSERLCQYSDWGQSERSSFMNVKREVGIDRTPDWGQSGMNSSDWGQSEGARFMGVKREVGIDTTPDWGQSGMNSSDWGQSEGARFRDVKRGKLVLIWNS